MPPPPEPPEPPPPGGGVQSSLFDPPESSKVVPIKPNAGSPWPPRPPAQIGDGVISISRRRPPGAHSRRGLTRDPNQGTLGFLPTAPAEPKILPTQVEAAISCSAKPASWRSRATAAAVDAGLAGVGLAIVALVFHYRCGAIPLDRRSAVYYLVLAALLQLFYEALWSIAGRETPGMREVRLRLLDFDGHRPDLRHRILWSLGAYLSLLAGVGLLWSLFDEEHLTLHDHMAKTFPTPDRRRDTPFHRWEPRQNVGRGRQR